MYIVITLPYFFDGEADAITLMFQSGLQRLHLRKPGSTIGQCRHLLHDIPECYHNRVVLHDHYMLADEFAVGGVHLNSRNTRPLRLPNAGESVSVSCHSIDELALRKREGYACADGRRGSFDYLSLSPIFDSISKDGYHAAFTPEELLRAKADGIIDASVIALGGICADNVSNAMQYGFGGVMVLGDAWKKEAERPDHSPSNKMGVILSIAGSDCSAGAGIQQDIKAASACGCYCATVITAVTSQNTVGVNDVMPVPPAVVESQLRSVFSDLRIDAVKIGMIPNRDVAAVIVRVLNEERRKRILPVVLDPVMISTSGTRLMAEDCVDYIVRELFPLCTLITPNIPEWEFLVKSEESQVMTCRAVLLKGGHAEGNEMTDTLLIREPSDTCQQSEYTFTSEKIETRNLHGTGCTLSTAIASFMAKQQSLATATGNAKVIMNRFIRGGVNLNIGHGNGPMWYNG